MVLSDVPRHRMQTDLESRDSSERGKNCLPTTVLLIIRGVGMQGNGLQGSNRRLRRATLLHRTKRENRPLRGRIKGPSIWRSNGPELRKSGLHPVSVSQETSRHRTGRGRNNSPSTYAAISGRITPAWFMQPSSVSGWHPHLQTSALTGWSAPRNTGPPKSPSSPFR